MSDKIINLVCDSKESIKIKVTDGLKLYLAGQGISNNIWSHAWNADGTRIDKQTATAGGGVVFTVS